MSKSQTKSFPAGFKYQFFDFVAVQKEFDQFHEQIYSDICTPFFYVKHEDKEDLSNLQEFSPGEVAPFCRGISSESLEHVRSFHTSSIESDLCFYCKNKMKIDKEMIIPLTELSTNRLLFIAASSLDSPKVDNKTKFSQTLYVCDYCGWWKKDIFHTSFIYFNNTPSIEKRFEMYIGKYGLQEDMNIRLLEFGVMKEFDLSSAIASLDDLGDWLARHPRHVVHTDPFVFEKLMGECFRNQNKYAEVRNIGGRRDRGIDLILLSYDNEQIIVQIKRRKSTNAVESVDTVRQLNGVLMRDGVPKGMVVTTAGGFTADAVAETRVHKHGIFERYSVELNSFDYVERLIRTSYGQDKEPWLKEPDYVHSEFKWLNRVRRRHQSRD